jgi:hypothetical protein
MKSKVKRYCQFCGTRVKKLSIMQGTYYSNSCPEPSCPDHGRDEQEDELDGLTIFTPGEEQDD